MTDSSINDMGAAKPSCEAKASEIVEAVEARFAPTTDITHVWGYDPNAGNVEHHSGLAADFMLYNSHAPGGIDSRAGTWIANYCITNAARLGVRWVIFQQRIYNVSKGYWRAMEDRGNPTNNHVDHVHVLFADSPYVRPGVTVVVRPSAPASSIPAVFARKPKLAVDGKLGSTTIRAWQDQFGTYEDGKISTPSSLVMALQRFLNAHDMRDHQAHRLVVDGYGLQPNLVRDYGPSHTVEALQRFYRTPVDGIVSFPSSALVKAVQTAINKHNGY